MQLNEMCILPILNDINGNASNLEKKTYVLATLKCNPPCATRMTICCLYYLCATLTSKLLYLLYMQQRVDHEFANAAPLQREEANYAILHKR